MSLGLPFAEKSIKLQPNDNTAVADTEVDWWHDAVTTDSWEDVKGAIYSLHSIVRLNTSA